MNAIDHDPKAYHRLNPRGLDMNIVMTALKPSLCALFVVARYFNRDESKSERTKQAVLDCELLLKELGIADPTMPAAK